MNYYYYYLMWVVVEKGVLNILSNTCGVVVGKIIIINILPTTCGDVVEKVLIIILIIIFIIITIIMKHLGYRMWGCGRNRKDYYY